MTALLGDFAMELASIGLIGLGTMGAALALTSMAVVGVMALLFVAAAQAATKAVR